ncbi:chloride channel protein [Niveibacterium sp. COAC-50]|uniref:chloride channel protein n=1 Tax=Niveibacterium sp. COAC-50 TaxID=2729384 RepID=UPI0015549BF0|nr:chloride channel protein [Niveibacterium sp. COAC-50]
MPPQPQVANALQQEFSDWRLWAARLVVLSFAAASGLAIVGFTWLAEVALAAFFRLERAAWWAPLIWTPLLTAGIVWLTRRFAPGAAGSGIPQIIAVLEHESAAAQRPLFVSMKLSVAKLFLTAAGLLGGLALGREGPSVQIAAGIMRNARRWLPAQSQISENGLLMAGGAAGIAAAFNTPLGGVMFAIEELSRRPEQRRNGLLIGAIVLAGLMAVSVYGNNTYFGVIRVERFSFRMVAPALLVALLCGAAGGLFARALIAILSGRTTDRFSRLRGHAPIRFAACCGLLVALIGIVSQGASYGSGYAQTKAMIAGASESTHLAVLLRFVATWFTAASGVPGGLFAPSLSIGAGLGNSVATLMAYPNAPTLIALGMAAFLAAVTQAPLTAFIIVMEMVDGHELVLSLMACTLIASGLSRLISAPLYPALAELQLARLK